jgi:hypothetical protein
VSKSALPHNDPVQQAATKDFPKQDDVESPLCCNRLLSAMTNDEALIELRKIFDVIDDKLGDTDPFLRDGMSDDDIKAEEPLLWCAMKLNDVIVRFGG